MSHQTTQSVPVPCARISPSHNILWWLARTVCLLKSELFISHPSALIHQESTMFGQLCVTATFNTDFVHFSFKTISRSDYEPRSLKRPLCLFSFLFGFHGLPSWLHRKQEKQTRKKDEICFTSVLFRENPSCSRQCVLYCSHKGVTSVRHVCTRYGL